MANDFLVWTMRQRAHWLKLLPKLQDGVIGTSEMRDGQRVDTTAATIAHTLERLAEIDALVEKYEARTGEAGLRAAAVAEPVPDDCFPNKHLT